MADEAASSGIGDDVASVTGPIEPRVTTAPVARATGTVWFAVLLFGAAAWMATPAIRSSGPPTSPAVVVGPAEEPGWTEVEVLEGPRPGVWELDGLALAPGTELRVDLRGECRCLPYPAAPRPVTNWAAVLILAGFGFLTARRAERAMRASRVTREARALLRAQPGPDAYELVPVALTRGRLEVRYSVRDDTGTDLGTVALVHPPPFPVPVRWVRIHGVVQPGHVVALSTLDGAAALLPIEPLGGRRPMGAGEPTPSTQLVVDLLGWGPPRAPSDLGGTGRVTPVQFGGVRCPPVVAAGARSASARWRTGRSCQLAISIASGCAIVAVPIAIGLGVVGAIIFAAALAAGIGSVVAVTRWADRPLVDALTAEGLVPGDERGTARLLLQFGFGRMQAPAEPAPERP